MKFGARRPPPAPDAGVIRRLAGLLAETGLSEIEYAVGDTRIRVARDAAKPAAATPATNGTTPPPASEPAAKPARKTTRR